MSTSLKTLFSPATDNVEVLIDPTVDASLLVTQEQYNDINQLVTQLEEAEHMEQGLEALIATLEEARPEGLTPTEAHWANVACRAIINEGLTLPEGATLESFATSRSSQLVSLGVEGLQEQLVKVRDFIVRLVKRMMSTMNIFVEKLQQNIRGLDKNAESLLEQSRKIRTQPHSTRITVTPSTFRALHTSGSMFPRPSMAMNVLNTGMQGFPANKHFNLQVKTFITSLVSTAEKVVDSGSTWRRHLAELNNLEPPVPALFSETRSQNSHVVERYMPDMPGGVIVVMRTASAENSHGARGSAALAVELARGVRFNIERDPAYIEHSDDTSMPVLSPSELQSVAKATKTLCASYRDYHATAKDLLQLSEDFVKRVESTLKNAINEQELSDDGTRIVSNILSACGRLSASYILGEAAFANYASRQAVAILRYAQHSLVQYTETVVAKPAYASEAMDVSLEKQWTAAERDAAPASAWAVPSKQKLRIDDVTHVMLAWSQLDRTKGLTDEEHAMAKKRILAAAKRFKLDTDNWNVSKEELDVAEDITVE